MRERLTASFVLLTVLALLGAGLVRAFVLRDLIREQESAHVHEQARLVARIVDDRLATGAAVDRSLLEHLVGAEGRLVLRTSAGARLDVRGSRYDAASTSDDLSSSARVRGGTVTVSQSPEVVRDIIGRELGSVVVLFVMIAALAAVVGFAVARALSAPFRRLAGAAAALGRGRFDLDLPRTRIPEARAISLALATSAGQLEERLRREREFAEHASHVLRTPLTGLRLELEDLSLRPDLPPDARRTAEHCVSTVDEMNAVAGELVALSRSGSLVAGAEVPLVDLATQVAQRWADRLAERGRTLAASVEGDLERAYTPGPVEHVLDLVLAEVVRHGTGEVRIVFAGEEGGHLRITVGGDASPAPTGDGPGGRLDRARAVVEALGGRISGEDPATGLVILLPRR